MAQTAISFETIRVFDFFIFDLSLHAISKLYAETIQVFNIFFFDLRWLDWIFLGGYLPSLSINYVGVSKDMEKKVITTVLYKDENFL